MTSKAAITVRHPREETERLWLESEHGAGSFADSGAAVSFVTAPGDHGTEIHVDLQPGASDGGLGGIFQKLKGVEPLARAKDELRRFKAWAETGEIPRSDAVPEGERVERKLHQRPAQPLSEDELAKVGA
jgi:uncharacterized membrane protein